MTAVAPSLGRAPPQQPVHVPHRLPPVIVGDMGVDVHRDGDLRVPKDLPHDAGRHTCGKQERGAPVPGVVQTNAGGPASSAMRWNERLRFIGSIVRPVRVVNT